MPNWVDTSGLEHGFLTIRWTYAEQPPEADWPTLEVKQVAFDDIADSLPSSTRSATAEERADHILMRHRHVQRRYRQY